MRSYRLGIRLLAIALFSLLAVTVQAIESYEFSDEQLRQRFASLTEELRCPKCQNQNIADSNAPIASDLRAEVHRLLESGQTDADIIAFMTERFGDFVRYRPPVNRQTWLLWFGPALLLLIAGAGVFSLIRARTRPDTAHLSDADKQRLQRLLDDNE